MHTRIRTGRRTVLVGAACAVAVATALPTASGASAASGGSAIVSAGPLRDLDVAAGPLDGALARVVAAPAGPDRTVVLLELRGVDAAAAGTTFGAHVHVGPCVAGNGAAALGHYLHSGSPSPQTEVWLDVTVTHGGTATSVAAVPFDIAAGAAQSVVLHTLPTAPNGTAGARLACLPVDF